MKKTLIVFVILVFFSLAVKAQTNYSAALGVGVDAISYATFIEATGKYFFSSKHAVQADVGFDGRGTILTALYSYHNEFFGTKGLRWYVGTGPSIVLWNGGENTFALRPHLGLDYKIKDVPFIINIDWRPAIVLSNGDNEVGALGLGLQFAFN
ncbi:hypothetical protein J0X14_16885 [Muricauda sp. CAU 1633]|uniref:hypothetical protein n=1 Tax=Allomuricauda sp. CAU 1633 TaxID=2816036 RepID=UPI001A90AFE7|nr:hypothetical protein [Muricauda sp. CAU 1633]MBO0323987.1 hypothetical protein [Muricauda sp. CAU 1633]